MKKTFIFIIIIWAILLSKKAFSQWPEYIQNHHITYSTLTINQFKFNVWNNGTFWSPHFVFDNIYQGDLLWPGGPIAYQWLNFQDAFFIWGKKVSKVYFNGDLSQFGWLRPGKILDNNIPDDFLKEKYRVYRIRKNWESTPYGPERDQLEKDYNEWPVEDGAPWVDRDNDGIFTRGLDQPAYFGDEIVFYTANDVNFPDSNIFNRPPGLEYHLTSWSFNRAGILGDAIFLKIEVINKQSSPFDSLYLSFVSGYETVNLLQNIRAAGCDTVLNLGYCYFTQNEDTYQYGEDPPAFGYTLLQGPLIKGSSSDSAYIESQWRKGFLNRTMDSFYGYFNNDENAPRLDDTIYATQPGTAYPLDLGTQYRNIVQGIYAGGYIHITDPLTGYKTPFMVPGDPETNTGWTAMNWPGNDSIPRPPFNFLGHYLSTGPFTLAPFDTQEVVYGILAARGADNLNSVTELKRRAAIIRKAYYLNFQLTPLPLHLYFWL